MLNIREEVNSFLNERNFNLKVSNHLRNESLFKSGIDEGDDAKREQVLNLIQNNQWEDQDPYSFYKSLKKSKHSLMLTDYSPAELSNMKLFKLKGYDIGFALKQFEDKGYKEIVAVHNNEPEVKNVGNQIMQAAIRNGGCYLDHFDGFLSNLYGNMGFGEYKREKYNPKYDKNGEFKARYGEQPVIYRIYKNCK